MTKPLLVLGCGGHGRVVADVATDCGHGNIAFLDDDEKLSGAHGGTVLGPMSMLEDLVGHWPRAIAAIGDGTERLKLLRRLNDIGFETSAIIHPSAIISRNAQIGQGVFVGPGAVINVGARIGDGAIVNTGARIDHDCMIGAGSHIAPGTTLSGGVTVGERTWLGTGCAVRQGVTIGDDVTVGVGAAVVTDLLASKTYVGVPARPLVKQA